MDRDLIAREVAERLGCTIDGYGAWWKGRRYMSKEITDALLDSEEKCRKLEKLLKESYQLCSSESDAEELIDLAQRIEVALSGKG